MAKKTKKKKKDDGLAAILGLFDRGGELEGQEGVDAFEGGLKLARARWSADAKARGSRA